MYIVLCVLRYFARTRNRHVYLTVYTSAIVLYIMYTYIGGGDGFTVIIVIITL